MGPAMGTAPQFVLIFTGFITIFSLIVISPISVVQAQRSINQSSCPAKNPSPASSHYDILLEQLTNCNYDQLTRPGQNDTPLEVYTKIFVYFLGSIKTQNLQFTTHILVRFRWQDSRLAFNKTHPDVSRVIGQSQLRAKIWVPHVYFVNEIESKLMGADQQEVLITVKPDGTVYYATRLKVTLFCLMHLKKFPFDEQECTLVLESWTYNMSELVLFLEPPDGVFVDKNLPINEYSLIRTWADESSVDYSESDDEKFGTFSCLEVKFKLARRIGYYIMDYYIPSIFLVVMSWLTFWLDPNAIPGRTTLGTTTLLAFITLAGSMGNSLPKVSYIKNTEIWFIVCVIFIFASLAEFAFVNMVWRRKKNIKLKKVNTKYVLHSTITANFRKEFRHNRQQAQQLQKSESIGNVSPPTADNGHNVESSRNNFTTMTPAEVANWIDRRCRIAFPLAFLLFNILYWGFVWI